jgi:hypothetical protein
MAGHAELLPRYKQLRQSGLALNTRLGQTLPKSAFGEGGRRLGILDGNALLLDTEDAIAVLMDFCLHDVRRRGVNAIEAYLAASPPAADSDEWRLLHALRAARFSVFAVEAVEAGVGVTVRDLMRDESTFLVDTGFGQSAKPGMVFAMRVMTCDGIGMSTGAALPVEFRTTAASRKRLAAELRELFAGVDFRNLSPEEAGEFAATVLRTCLADGAAEQIAYVKPIDPKPKKPRPRRKK